jgi:Flp pilus assembly protein TadG
MRNPLIWLRKLWQRRDGSALIEFAIAAPVLLTIFVGITEVSRYLLFRDKLQSAATQMLDIINQNSNVNQVALDNLFGVLTPMMSPYVGKEAEIIVTQILKPKDDIGGSTCAPVALWQYPPSSNSQVATSQGTVAKTGDIQLAMGDNLMAIEIYVNYVPFFDNALSRSLVADGQMYTITYEHTRYGTFNIDPNTGNVMNAPCL